MTERIRRLKQFFVLDKAHHAARFAPQNEYRLAADFAQNGLSDLRRATERLKAMLGAETPVIFPLERIVFTRRNPTVFSLFTAQEMETLRKTRTLHERGEVCNINVDYTRLLNRGLKAVRAELCDRRDAFEKAGDRDRAEYLAMQVEVLDAVQELSNRYREQAVRDGRAGMWRICWPVCRWMRRAPFPRRCRCSASCTM